MSDLSKNLKYYCIWHQVKDSRLYNGYPYSEHLEECEICQAANELERLKTQVDDLSMFIRRLVQSSKSGNINNDLQKNAMDYLKREGLTGKITRHA